MVLHGLMPVTGSRRTNCYSAMDHIQTLQLIIIEYCDIIEQIIILSDNLLQNLIQQTFIHTLSYKKIDVDSYMGRNVENHRYLCKGGVLAFSVRAVVLRKAWL